MRVFATEQVIVEKMAFGVVKQQGGFYKLFSLKRYLTTFFQTFQNFTSTGLSISMDINNYGNALYQNQVISNHLSRFMRAILLLNCQILPQESSLHLSRFRFMQTFQQYFRYSKFKCLNPFRIHCLPLATCTEDVRLSAVYGRMKIGADNLTHEKSIRKFN